MDIFRKEDERKMLKLTGSEDYYPTPKRILDEITAGLDWDLVEYVLEPSAGTGNIAEYVRANRRDVDIDCIEIEGEYRAILKDKKFRVVHDDFLSYHTYKHYDLIIMNPPFSEGVKHILKAIEMQKQSGGGIICILNAETIRNAYTKERQELQRELEACYAEIEYYENAFTESERPTEVEIAVVKMSLPEPERETTIFETLREKVYDVKETAEESYELAEQDIVKIFVSLYNREIEWGLRLYDEYREYKKKVLDGKSRLELAIRHGEYGSTDDFKVNSYIQEVRRKYWEKLFRHPKIMGKLTSNLEHKYLSQVDKYAKYDFSYWNIKTVQEEMSRNLIKGVEACILELFEELSHKHSWSEEIDEGNIHYYNGWKTNKSWKINERVVIPIYGYHNRWQDNKAEFDPFREGAFSKLSDIEKVLNYLDSGETREIDIRSRLQAARELGQTRKIELKYFEVTFYKKGTCHLTFTNKRLLKKLNIFGSQGKHWLPPGYGSKRYEEFTEGEQEVIESFEGRESYTETVMEARYYLFDAGQAMPMLTKGGK